MDTIIVIPARFGSRRFPGKPLAPVKGRSLLHRTWSIAKAVRNVAAVHIATDDERIAEHARGFGAEVIMTSPDCENGTARVREAVRGLKQPPDVVVNLQGDALLTPPWVIQALVDEFRADPAVRLATPAVHCSWAQYEEIRRSKLKNPGSGTLVVFDRRRNALYFSKTVIPHLRTTDASAPPPVHRHIGVYAYRSEVLDALVDLPPTPLEAAEQLEQLRALEHGIPIRVVPVDYRGRTHWSVDAPEDVALAEALIEREGELT